MQKLEFIYKLDSQTSVQLWEKIEIILGVINEKHSLSYYGEKIKSSKIKTVLKRQQRKAFNIENESFAFHLATVTNFSHSFLQIKSKKSCEEGWWSAWVDEFICLEGFVQAWLVDCDFDYWQNAKDPLEYESKGKSYDGLPIISNGLPAPLEQFEVDITKNLGLRKLCEGYVEVVGGQMWLSEYFLDLIGKEINVISRDSEVMVEKVTADVYKLTSSSKVFTTDNSVEQKKLRQALYDKNRR